MKKKRILALFLAAVSCLSLAVSVSAATTPNRKTTDFRDFDKSAWYAEAVSAAVDNGLLYGKSSTIIDPNGDMTRAEMAAIINRSFGCYKTADISQYKDVSKSKWYYDDIAMSVQMGTYNGRSSSSMAPDAPITREEAMTVVARALELDYDAYAMPALRRLSSETMKIVHQNFAMVIGVNTVGLILGAASGISVMMSAVLHNLSTILVVGNSLRLMIFPPMEE